MCELCRHNPCSAGCPNAPEPDHMCEQCGRGIYAGELYYVLGGCEYCPECVEAAAEFVPEEYDEPDEDRIYDEWRDRQLMEEWENERET